jgi:hypothetical protein
MAASPRGKRSPELAYAALQSSDVDELKAALERIADQGDAKAIRPLLTVLMRPLDTEVHDRVRELLFQVKAKGAVPELMAALEEPAFHPVRHTILAIVWNAGLDVREHLGLILSIGLSGDAELLFECLTVVENQEIWPERDARTALRTVQKAMHDGMDPYKAHLVKALSTALEYRLGHDVTEDNGNDGMLPFPMA